MITTIMGLMCQLHLSQLSLTSSDAVGNQITANAIWWRRGKIMVL